LEVIDGLTDGKPTKIGVRGGLPTLAITIRYIDIGRWILGKVLIEFARSVTREPQAIDTWGVW